MARTIINMATGKIEVDQDYLPEPADDFVPSEVSEAQFMRAAVRLELVSPMEAEAYMGRGEIPTMIDGFLATLPEPIRIDARLKVIGATKFYRNDEIFTAMVAAGVFTSEQIDEVFTLAATL